MASGFSEFDKVKHGWQEGNLIVVGGVTSMGKTSFVLTAARSAAVDHGKAVLIFSLEMSKEQLADRMIATESGIALDKINTRNLNKKEWEKIHKTTELLKDAPIYIDDTPGLCIRDLLDIARSVKKRYDTDLIIVDFLQLMDDMDIINQPNREQQISRISRVLKALSKELKIPIIACSQVSRSVEAREGAKRPQLSDLRDSGAIGEVADMVIFLYRPEYYGIEECENGDSTKGLTELIVAKHRNGPTGRLLLYFDAKRAKFSDYKKNTSEYVGVDQTKKPF